MTKIPYMFLYAMLAVFMVIIIGNAYDQATKFDLQPASAYNTP